MYATVVEARTSALSAASWQAATTRSSWTRVRARTAWDRSPSRGPRPAPGRPARLQSARLVVLAGRGDLFLGAQDAELVALGVGQHHPAAARSPVAAGVEDLGGAVVQQPRQLV